jgi:hypothetical protein
VPADAVMRVCGAGRPVGKWIRFLVNRGAVGIQCAGLGLAGSARGLLICYDFSARSARELLTSSSS